MDVPISRVRVLSFHRLIIGVVVAFATLMLAGFPRWTVDDAYISFRYAANLVTYGDLTWNLGPNPVEGYTGVLWTLLIAAGIALGASPVTTSQVLGVLALLASWWFVAQLLIELKASPRARLVGFVLFGSAGFLWRHAFGGLETMLFTALVCWAFLAHLQQRQGFLALLLLAVSLTRPEGVLLALVLFGYGAWDRRRQRGELASYLGSFYTLYGLPAVLYFLWRYDYYGYLLPNTFYVKGGTVWDGGASWASLGQMVLLYFFIPAAAAAGTGSVRQAGAGRRRFFLALALFGFPLVALYLRSSLVMDYAGRFWTPLYPLAVVALALLVDTSKRWRSVAAALALQVAMQASIWTYAEWKAASVYQVLLADEHRQAAAYVKQYLPPGESLIVYVDAGVAGYYSLPRPIVDFGGLNDEYLAQLWASGGDPHLALEYFYSRRAGAILWTPEAATWPGPYGVELAPLIVEDPRWQDYQLVAEWDSPSWRDYRRQSYRQQLYFRRDLIKE